MKLALELDSDRVEAGGKVAGRIAVLEGGSSRKLALTLNFHEETRDYLVTPYSADTVVREGEVATGQSFEFRFTMPPEAHPSVKAKHSELYWELEVASDEPGLDSHGSRRLEVVAQPKR